MSAKQFVSLLPYYLSASLTWMATLIAAIWISKSPGEISDYAFPCLAGISLILTVLSTRATFRKVGASSLLLAPMMIFLCSIPIYLIIEVTIF